MLPDLLWMQVYVAAFFLDVGGEAFDVLGWVLHAQIMVKLEVYESEQCYVKLTERTDDCVINIEWQSLIKLVRRDPSDLLAHYLDLVVRALDAEESLREALSNGAVSHPF